MDVIKKLLENAHDLPGSPQIFPKLMELLRSEDATLEEVGDLIVLEPAITAKLLQYCNSAYFRRVEPVSNVPEAIGRVGFQTIYVLVTIVTGAQLLALPVGSGLDIAQLWRHSLTSAFAAKLVAESLATDGNMLFTAGLLHDMGRVVLAKVKGAEYGHRLQRVARSKTSLLEAELSTFGFSHAEVGACLMENWRLPKPLIGSVRYHHNPAAAGDTRQNAACICLSNALAYTTDDSAQSGCFLPDPDGLKCARELLKIDDEQMAGYVEQMKETMSLIETVLQN